MELRKLHLHFTLLFYIFFTTHNLFAQDGSIDNTFGNSGKVIHNIYESGTDKGYGIGVQSTGKIIVVGNSHNVLVVLRLNSDGSFDKTFGEGGKKFFPDISLYQPTLEIQSDDKIFMMATGSNPTRIVRLTANGELDPTFDYDGIKSIYNIYSSELKYLSSGKIFIVGRDYANSRYNVALVRLNNDGSMDSGFSGDGYLLHDAGYTTTGYGVDIQSDGTIITVGGCATSDFYSVRVRNDGTYLGYISTDFDGDDDTGYSLAVASNDLFYSVGLTHSNSSLGIASFNSSGSLNTSFSSDGKDVISNFGAGVHPKVLVQSDDKIIVGGKYASYYVSGDFMVVRYNTDGTFDSGFGSSGQVSVDFGNEDWCYDMVLQSDGKILAVGSSDNGDNEDFSIIRLNTDGSLDNTFSSDGKIMLDFHSDDYGRSVAITDDDKIFVLGYTKLLNDNNFLLAKYLSNGTPDNNFSDDAFVSTDINGGDDYGRSLIHFSNGKNLAVGYTDNGNDYDFALVKYNSDGSLDNSFGTNGIVTTDLNSSKDDRAFAALLQSDGKIVVTGYSGTATTDYDVAIVRYNSDGTLDNTFGTNGIVIKDIYSSSDDKIYAATLQSDGKIIAAGSYDSGSSVKFLLVRLNTNGTFDNTFDGNGVLTTEIGTKKDAIAYGVTTQSDNKIVASGRFMSSDDDKDFIIVRYLTDGTLDNSFDANGIVSTDFSGDDDYGYSICMQGDDKIFVGGMSINNSGNNNFAIARYNTNGSLDNSFDDNGILTTDVSTNYDKGFSILLQDDGKIILGGYSNNGYDYDISLARYNNALYTPVELISFIASQKGDDVFLEWETATEVDNYGFEVQRNSTSAPLSASWETLGFVKGHGNSNSPKDYSFVDKDELNGSIKYRLKQIDFDGGFEYSKIAKINGTTEFKLLQNYPNPFNPSTVIKYSIPKVGMVTLKIYNMLGEEVATLINKEMDAGVKSITFDASNLSSGLYLYRISYGNPSAGSVQGFVDVKKMLLLK